MSKESIKGTIDANIKQNGQGLITGIVMNSVLKDMVDDEYSELGDLALEIDELEEKYDTITGGNTKFPLNPYMFNVGYFTYSASGWANYKENDPLYNKRVITRQGVEIPLNVGDIIKLSEYGSGATYYPLTSDMFTLGRLILDSANNDWTYYDDGYYKDRLITKRGTTLHLKVGDVISLSTYEGRRFYPSWSDANGVHKRVPNGTQSSSNGWITQDFSVYEEGDYVIMISENPDVVQTSIDALYNLLSIKTSDSSLIRLYISWRDDDGEYHRIPNSWTDEDGSHTSDNGWISEDFKVYQNGSYVLQIANYPEQVQTSIDALYDLLSIEFGTQKDKGRLDYAEEEIARLKTEKQDKLIAGANIVISGNVISALGGGSTDDTTILVNELRQLNYPVKPNGVVSNINKQLVLLHFSDIHSDKDNLERIVAFKNNYSQFLTDVLCTGDVMYQYADEAEGAYTGFNYWTAKGANSFMLTLGNHDVNKVGNTLMSASDCRAKFFTPFLSDAYADAVFGGDSVCYYYKDYADEKVRLICLDWGHQDATQLAWFESALNGAKTLGYAVLCAEHCPFVDTYMTPSKNTFDALLPLYSNAQTMQIDYANKVKSFMDNGGEFICWLAGHTHRDRFSTLEGYGKQVVINVAEAMIRYAGGYGDIERTKDTITQDLFNIFAVDTTTKTFRILRIGANTDRLMRLRYSLCYDYANKVLIYER